MATFYVSPTTATPAGNNSNNGSISAPWATLSYAITRVLNSGDIIHVNAGTYPAITTQMLLANGVSIEGDGRTTTIIPMTYSAGDPCIKLETWGGWANKATVGHQHISGIKFVGSTTPGTPVGLVAIKINYRHHVEIYDCEFVDFVRSAVKFNGEQAWNGFSVENPYYAGDESDFVYMPFEDSFCEGNKFYDNIVHNCCGIIVPGQYSGELEVSTNDGIEVYGNHMTATGRSGSDNGVPIKFIGDGSGFNRNSKIYNNTIIAGHMSTNYWQFAIEIWWDLGGTEIYNNYCEGAIDLCDSWDHYDVGFGIRCHDNEVGYSANTTNLDRGILFEGTHIKTFVYNNHIHHVARGITFNNNNTSEATVYNGVYIYCNLIHHLSGRTWQTWGLLWDYDIVEQGGLFQHIYIQHNTIHASSDAPDPTAFGIMLPTADDFDHVYIENNILINWERGAIRGDHPRDQATNIFIRNNLIYDSYNDNDPYYADGFPTAGITYSGTIKEDPLFLSSSDFHLQATSPAVNAGRDTDITHDYDGNLFDDSNPSIGAFELLSVKKLTTINIVGDSIVRLFYKPSWITVLNNATDAEINAGDIITDGMVLAIHPNSENLGGYRMGFVILRDSLPAPDELSIRVVQDMNPNGPTVSVALNEGIPNNLQLISVGPNTTEPDLNYLNINFTPHNPNYGEGAYLNINYEFSRNGIYEGAGVWSGNNDTPLSRQLSTSGPVLMTDNFEVLVWSI